MKLNKTGIVFGALSLLLATGCDRELPYDLDGVTRGVLIDMSKTPDTDFTFDEGSTDGNFSVRMTIPWQQGDYSQLQEAQLLCVFTPVNGGARK